MNVLLTGAFGNLGAAALPPLLGNGHKVRCVDLNSRSNVRVAASFRERIEVRWCDIRSPEDVFRAVEGQDVIVHLAGALPPLTEEHPAVTRQINVEGTRHLLLAAQRQRKPVRFVFASSVAVFGCSPHLRSPRQSTDPTMATDHYTSQKLECEELVRRSGLDWLILRFAAVPPRTLQPLHPMVFDISLDNRLELLHRSDAGSAITNALGCGSVWGRALLIGGGVRCQTSFREYLDSVFEALGLGPLPREAFGSRPFYTDWLETGESQQLLDYQRHSMADIISDFVTAIGRKRHVLPLLRPLIRRWLLKQSPYWRREVLASGR